MEKDRINVTLSKPKPYYALSNVDRYGCSDEVYEARVYGTHVTLMADSENLGDEFECTVSIDLLKRVVEQYEELQADLLKED